MMLWLSERFNPGPLFAWMCVACVLLIPIVWLFARRRGRRATLRFSSVSCMTALGSTWAVRTRFVIPLLRTLAIAALLVALARPQSGGEYRDTSEGIAIQMVLDVSGSMSEEDFVIDNVRVRRLDAVKRVFRDFVLGQSTLGGRESDLIGMTTFAQYADTPCPLTLDHGSLADLLVETEIPGWVDGRQVRENPESGFTGLGDAIALATDDLRRAGEQAVAGVPGSEAAKSRVMILLTDGENHPAVLPQGPPPPDPLEAAKVAARLGIKIYTIGAVGSAQSPTRFGFFQRRRAGVDERLLKQVAAVTGAEYFRATDTDSLIRIYDAIDQMERHHTGERSFHDNTYAAKIAMLTGLGLLMLELFLVSTRYRTIP